MSTLKDLTVNGKLNVEGDASFTGTIDTEGIKVGGSSAYINGIIIAKGTTGSLNSYTQLQELPEGFTPLNSVVLGWALIAANGNRVEHAPSVNVWLGNKNIQVRVTDNSYVNCDITAYILRITE